MIYNQRVNLKYLLMNFFIYVLFLFYLMGKYDYNLTIRLCTLYEKHDYTAESI